MNLALKIATEFTGTFVLISIILGTNGNAYATVVALALVILLGNLFTTMYVNPAIVLMSFLNDKFGLTELMSMVISQVVAVIAAVVLYKRIKN